jgi:hypothetical protein
MQGEAIGFLRLTGGLISVTCQCMRGNYKMKVLRCGHYISTFTEVIIIVRE